MVSELQFVAIAVFLIWCLVSSLCGVLRPETVEQRARLVWRDRDATGWSDWREVHYGLTTANRRILAEPQHAGGDTAYAGLFNTVMHQAHRPGSDAVQFAVVQRSPASGRTGALFVSDVHPWESGAFAAGSRG